MAKNRANPNVLLVEGEEDQKVIPYLMDKFVDWTDSQSTYPVQIYKGGSVENAIGPTLSTHLKVSNLSAFGLVVDADSDVSTRWMQIRRTFLENGIEFSDNIDSQGEVVVSAGKRYGVWIMPDNGNSGMLEDFLSQCSSGAEQELWIHAVSCCESARGVGAKFRECHSAKAKVHTWLAWQDPPGLPLSMAVKGNLFDCRTKLPIKFAKWFIDLFGTPLREGVLLE